MRADDRAGFAVGTHGGLRVIRCEALSAVPGVDHGFSTRQGEDGDDFDLGRAVGRDPAALRRHRALLDACGLAGRPPAALNQVHGNRVLRLGTARLDGRTPGDAIVALREARGMGAPGVRYADCLPVLLADRRGRAVAAVHAGWRGSAAGVAARAVEDLAEAGIPPASLIAALGPAIGPCCYEVSGDVLRAVARAAGADVAEVSRPLPGGTRALDLAEANRRQLIRAGVPTESVHRAPWCTFCEDSLFFSHRRQGSPAGRMLACIGWTADEPLP